MMFVLGVVVGVGLAAFAFGLAHRSDVERWADAEERWHRHREVCPLEARHGERPRMPRVPVDAAPPPFDSDGGF